MFLGTFVGTARAMEYCMRCVIRGTMGVQCGAHGATEQED
jgi:hypothetical protein